MSNNRIPIHSILGSDVVEKISVWAEKNSTISELVEFLSLKFQIDITSDVDIVNVYEGEGGKRNSVASRGLGDVYERQQAGGNGRQPKVAENGQACQTPAVGCGNPDE